MISSKLLESSTSDLMNYYYYKTAFTDDDIEAIMKLTEATKISIVQAMIISFLPHGAVLAFGKNLK